MYTRALLSQKQLQLSPSMSTFDDKHHIRYGVKQPPSLTGQEKHLRVKSNGSKSVRKSLPDLPSYPLHFARARTVVPMHRIVVHGAPRCKRAMSALVNRQLQTNFVLLIAAPAPSILFCLYCAYACTHPDKSGVCILTDLHTLVLLNALFFLNVCVIFWLLSLLQGSTWVTF